MAPLSPAGRRAHTIWPALRCIELCCAALCCVALRRLALRCAALRWPACAAKIYGPIYNTTGELSGGQASAPPAAGQVQAKHWQLMSPLGRDDFIRELSHSAQLGAASASGRRRRRHFHSLAVGSKLWPAIAHIVSHARSPVLIALRVGGPKSLEQRPMGAPKWSQCAALTN